MTHETRRSFLLGALLALDGASCAPPARAATVRELDPEDQLPADLDLVVRVDVAKLRRAAGEATWQRLVGDDRSRTDGRAVLVGELAARAARVLVGFRGTSGEDSVLVAHGDFATLDGATLGPALRLAYTRGDERVYAAADRVSRSAPAWLAVRPRSLVTATTAEVDGVERVRRAGPDSARLDPPADAVLGLALRPRALAASTFARAPSVKAALADALSLRGRVDVVEGKLTADLLIACRDEPAASRAEARLRDLADALRRDATGPAAALAEGASVGRGAGKAEVVLRLRAAAASVLTPPALPEPAPGLTSPEGWVVVFESRGSVCSPGCWRAAACRCVPRTWRPGRRRGARPTRRPATTSFPRAGWAARARS